MLHNYVAGRSQCHLKVLFSECSLPGNCNCSHRYIVPSIREWLNPGMEGNSSARSDGVTFTVTLRQLYFLIRALGESLEGQ